MGGREVFTVLEFGDSKICALHGGRDNGGNPEILGFGWRNSNGAIQKGEIVDMAKTGLLLSEALDDADKSAGAIFSREKVYYLISGKGIRSMAGEGNVMIYGDPVITPQQMNEVISKAQNVPVPQGCTVVDSFCSYFTIDGKTRVKNPIGLSASRLDALVHIILADRNAIESMRSAIRDLGFENEITPVFSGSASLYGCLTTDEKENGVFLIDIGTALTEYMIICREGVLASGTIPVGTDHLANDLAEGLNLTVDQARRILLEGRIEKLKNEGEAFLEIEESTGAKRRIPLGSFEKIFEERIFELFELLKKILQKQEYPRHTFTGCVISGGGAMIPGLLKNAEEILGIHVRAGTPLAFSGAMTGLDTPRFSAILGALRMELEVSEANPGQLRKVADVLEDFTGGLVEKMKNVTKVFGK